MPVSRKRKPKRPTPRPAARRPVRARPLRGEVDKLGLMLERMPREALAVLFPPSVSVDNDSRGVRGNVYVDASSTLHHAYAQFGIASTLMPISLAIEGASGARTSYGTSRPQWEEALGDQRSKESRQYGQ